MSNTWWVIVALGIAACGDNAADREPAKLVVRTDPAGAVDCRYGGSVVSSGLDTNRNGVLDDGEVVTQTALCNDPPVQPSPKILVRLVAEPIGEHCALGGTAVQSGPDRNGNGVLDDDEVVHIDYVCGEVLLTRLAAEPAGARCIAGGVAFLVGRDRNRDGQLGDDEVEQTEVSCGDELSRDVAIRTAADAAALAKITVINGSLALDASNLDELALPALTVVRGALEIKNEASLVHLAMPVLQSVAGRFALVNDRQLTALDLPLLSRVGSLVIDGVAAPDLRGLPALAVVPGDIQITGNAVLASADLPIRGTGGSVTIDRNAQLGQLSWRAGSRLGPVHIASNPALTSIAIAPDNLSSRLASMTIASNAQLTEISITGNTLGEVAIDDNPVLANVTVTVLLMTGGLAVRGNGPLSLTLVTDSIFDFAFRIGGSLALAGPITALHSRFVPVVSGDCTLDGTQLVSFDPPNQGMECDGSLRVTGNAQLTRMPFVALGGGLELRGNAALPQLAFLSQTEIDGDLVVADNAALHAAPSLEMVNRVRGDVTIASNPALKNAFSPALEQIDGTLSIEGDDSLQDPGLASLRRAGALSVASCASLTKLELPALRDVPGGINIRGNIALHDLQLPVLRRADLGVFDNPHLPACEIEALFANMLGDHHESGNDDTAVCAP